MKSYKERTKTVIDKIERHDTKGGYTVKNGGNTLALKRRKRIIIWTAFATVCLAILVSFNLILFLPYPVAPEISAYRDSEYYGLISVVNGIARKNPYKNNFDKWTSQLGYGNKGDAIAPGDINTGITAPGIDYPADDATNDGNGDYVENTNNQVKAVTEADLLKRSTDYAFYLSTGDGIELLAYKLNGKSTALTSSYKVQSEKNTYYYFNTCEAYLSADCKTITVICGLYDTKEKQTYTCIVNLDVSNVNDVKESGRIYVSGSYISSRLVKGKLLLFTNYAVKYNPDFSNEKDFVPQTGTLNNLKSLPMEDIVYSENATSARYTVVCSLEQSSLEINSNYAFLSFSQEAYVSESNIFLTRAYNGGDYNADVYYDRMTDITCVSYADGKLDLVNTATVPGTVLNQYSMDEYNGVLRVVTQYYVLESYDEGKTYYRDYIGASLFCIDLESFEICADYKEFCPNGERVYSVRFDGNTAYVCTALIKFNWATDPVYAIDLSDLDNITSKDTGTISGYSLSLTKFKDGTLLGIGYGENTTDLKIELYTETQDGVESAATFEMAGCKFSEEFKAYFIDAENGLIGLGIERPDGGSEYILLLYDGYGLRQVDGVKYTERVNYDSARAFIDNGYIYVFSDKNVDVIDWDAQ